MAKEVKEVKIEEPTNKTEIKPFLGINIERNGRKYVFSMEVGSPIGEAYDAAYMVLSELLEMSKKAVANADPKKEKDCVEVEETKE